MTANGGRRDNVMKRAAGRALQALALAAAMQAAAAEYPNRWVFFDRGLKDPAMLGEFSNVVTRAARAGFTGIAISQGIEHAAVGDAGRARTVAAAKSLCDGLGLEIIPVVWSIGYDCAGLSTYFHPDIVEATPLKGLQYVVRGDRAVFVPRELDQRPLANLTKGRCEMTLPRFGHYRLKFELKTENLLPDVYSKFRMFVFHSPKGVESEEGLELYDPKVRPTQDYTPCSLDFNTYDENRVDLVAGKFGKGVTGSVWVRGAKLVEVPPSRFLTSDGMEPVVRGAESGTVYEEGRDYAPFPKMKWIRPTGDAINVEILPGGRIRDGERLLVDAWIPAVEGNGQYCVCPSAPRLYEYFRRTAKEINRLVAPRHWLLSMDEVRVMNRCRRCLVRKTDPAHLYADCVTKAMAIVREASPGAEVCAWSDMMAPTDNARERYYVCNGSLAGSWNLVPKDLVQVVWENGRGPVALKHFSGLGFRTLANCYYDMDDTLENDRRWVRECNKTPGCIGVMFYTYHRNYKMLERFAEMLRAESSPNRTPLPRPPAGRP